MKSVLITLITLLLCACGNGSSKNESTHTDEGVFNAQENIDTSDIEGLWLNSCTESEDLEKPYYREFLVYKPGDTYIGNQMSFGNEYYSDANCMELIAMNLNQPNLTDVQYNPFFGGPIISTDFSSIGIYTNSEGIVAKVIELDSEVNQSTRLAYYTDENTLYFSFEYNSGYMFDYENTYRKTQ